jgi:hypothetical protein
VLYLTLVLCVQYLVLAAETAPFLYEVEEDDDEVQCHDSCCHVVDVMMMMRDEALSCASHPNVLRLLKLLHNESSKIWRRCWAKACRTTRPKAELVTFPSMRR